MKCHAFRRKYTVQALSGHEELMHIAACVSCARFAEKLCVINRKLIHVLETPRQFLSTGLRIALEEKLRMHKSRYVANLLSCVFSVIIMVLILDY
jgi:hypothetical protein